jgi:hypothetical protein
MQVQEFVVQQENMHQWGHLLAHLVLLVML